MNITESEQLYYIQCDTNEFERMADKLVRAFRELKIYEYKHSEDRVATFLKELAYVIEACEIPMEVFARDKHIYPSYVLEKLRNGQRILNNIINFFERKEEELRKEENE